ncbi:HAMP domain-containing sensor histidine kinase [Streptomyces sp. WAC06614]|uniref:sensor histidine kinase n=1 Tax=Streptomyces sp. WAC06614 TaxID=2487416 RepID=UPI000F7BA635|nr:HAMP domain-containing sensor histidine kinase [Streptomyces sp. WAC06614]RSS66132.1 sensor histidine kinase [Streptomyces sp. WAC06614]
MRWRIALRVAFAALLSTAIFALPLALYARHTYLQEAGIEARARAVSLATVLSDMPGDEPRLEGEVRRFVARQPGVTVFFPDGRTVGEPVDPVPHAVRRVAEQETLTAVRARLAPGPCGQAILIPVISQDGHPLVTAVFIDTSRQWALIHRVWTAIGLALLLLPVCAALLADRFGRTLARQHDQLVRAATAMAGGDLTVRVALAGPPELIRLGNSFNSLASRIEDRVKAEREAAADFSHRLRTPVAALMLQAQSLADPKESAHVLESARRLQREVSYVIERTRHPALDHHGASSDLAAIARERVAFWEPLAEDQLRSCRFTVSGNEHTVRAPGEALAAAVDALLGNVFSHTPEGTGLRVRVVGHGGARVRLVVEDDGPGIDPAHLRRGASGSGSSGLGLDIVRRLAQSTGGGISLTSPPGGGARVQVVFGSPDGLEPLAPPPAAAPHPAGRDR